MICHLQGRVLKKGPDFVVLDVHGVGYRVFVSQNTLGALPGQGQISSLEIHTHVREDAFLLFGFLSSEERETFEALISVNGFGPKAAIGVLSGIEARELARAVCSGDVARLCLIPGIGKKRAERMMLDLKDRLLPLAQSDSGPGDSVSVTLEYLRSALSNLGFKGVEVENTVGALRQRAIQGVELEDLLPEALRLLRSTP